MKRVVCLLIIVLTCVSLVACGNKDQIRFSATVLESNGTLLVEPRKDSMEYRSSDKIAVHTEDAVLLDSLGKKIVLSKIQVGQTVEITYSGVMRESYPAQIYAYEIKIVQ